MEEKTARQKASEKYRQTHKEYYKEYYKNYYKNHSKKNYAKIYKNRLDMIEEYMTRYIELENIEPVIKEFEYLLKIARGELDE